MKISVNSMDMFVTRVWTFDLSELEHEFSGWKQSIHEQRASSPAPQGRSNRLGWNSEKNIFNNPNFTPLKQASEKCFLHCFREMGVEVDEKAFDISAWVNMTYPGGYNVQHGHPRAYLSGCFYLETPENSGRISFADPRPGAVYAPLEMAGPMSSRALKAQPRSGQLIIFPSWLEHSVELNESRENRVSIAMNVVQPSQTTLSQ